MYFLLSAKPARIQSPTLSDERDCCSRPSGGARPDLSTSGLSLLACVLAAVRSVSSMGRWLAHPYFQVKELIESQMLEASRHGLLVVIANPTYCLGPWDLHDRQLCTIPLLLSGEIPSSITQTLNVIDVRDVAAAICGALDAECYGEPLQMSGHDISTEELYTKICELGGVRRPRISTATTVAIASAYTMELM